MIKSFGQWIVVNDGIETGYYYPYNWIPKQVIMDKDYAYFNDILKDPTTNRKSLLDACRYAYQYFHAIMQYSTTHPNIHRQMLTEFENLNWSISAKGNYTLQVPEGFTITVYKKPDTDRWAWVFNDIYCHRTFKTAETAKKKAYSGYYWYYKHIKNNSNNTCPES